MPDIILVRHAATAWSGRRYCGRSDPPLSEEGAAAAARLAAELAPTVGADWLVVSSPSTRALATARAIAAAVGVDAIEIDERWREADFGIAEGRTFEDLAILAPDVAAALAAGTLTIDWPGGETNRALEARVASAWAELVGREGPAVVVTHAGPLLHAAAIAGARSVAASDLVEPAGYVRLQLADAGRPGSPVLPSPA